ncbi:MAG TPA: hypothetical protein VN618_12395 [Solirubrobacteraceae bacterium]|nr:hypothetical protein [Solirubrobacteraceae bacterium]
MNGDGQMRSTPPRMARAFGLAATVTTLVAPTVVGFVAAKLAVPLQVLLIVAAGVLGYLAVPVMWAITCTLRAPTRQRDEVRARLLELRTEAPASDFSDWVAAKRAALPTPRGFGDAFAHMSSTIRMRPEDRAKADWEFQKQQSDEGRAIEAIHAQTRTEYHERFRSAVVAVLGDTPQTRAPQTIADMEALCAQFTQVVEAPASPTAPI